MNGPLTTEQFIAKAIAIHGSAYDYSKVEYERNSKKVCIICPKHGEFWQTPNNHLTGFACRFCGYEYKSRKRAMTKKEFIEKANNIHKFKYDYSKVEYTNKRTKVCIVCPKHGEFWITPERHIYRGAGCTECNKDSKK